MLILFDIDATLLRTNGAGLDAMRDAGRALFGDRFRTDGVDTAGQLDPVIMHDLLGANGVASTGATLAAFREAYIQRLPNHLARAGGGALPGTMELLDALSQADGVTLGLLTGNFEPSGRAKLRSCGFDDARFRVAAWGDDSPNRLPERRPVRDDLPPIALERAGARTRVHPARSLIIGDTPHDVRCALAHGLRVLGVATGGTPRSDLMACGADHAVDDLSDTPEILSWITQTLA